MANKSSIEWTHATWNPITGCSVVSPGCTNCYAMKLAGTRLRDQTRYKGLTVDSKAGPVWNGEVRFIEEVLMTPLHWRKPRMIFVNSMSDLFHENLPDEVLDKIFAVMALCPQHTFQVLTKRAERMKNYCNKFGNVAAVLDRKMIPMSVAAGAVSKAWPLPNVWLGVSCEDQVRADERIPHLLQTPAAVRFISAEPLLGPIDLTNIHFADAADGTPEIKIDALNGLFTCGEDCDSGIIAQPDPKLDWVIVGGESGKGARPMHPDWARSLRDQCAAEAVDFFFKQWGNWKDGSDFASDAMAVTTDGRIIIPDPEHLKIADRDKPVMQGQPTLMRNVGKSKAGRLLDGKEHNAMPSIYAADKPLHMEKLLMTDASTLGVLL